MRKEQGPLPDERKFPIEDLHSQGIQRHTEQSVSPGKVDGVGPVSQKLLDVLISYYLGLSGMYRAKGLEAEANVFDAGCAELDLIEAAEDRVQEIHTRDVVAHRLEREAKERSRMR